MSTLTAALLGRRLVLVTGKGGVGRSTVAGALALAAAASGRRTVVCEVSEQERLARLFGREQTDDPEPELAPGLWGASIDPRAALNEWLAATLGSRLLARPLTQSGAFAQFAAAAPGTAEMATLSKVWELTQDRRWRRGARSYDLVVLDAPATGHFLGMVRTPRTFARLARVGPIRRQADRVAELLGDPRRAGYLGVATPAELPVTETLELERRLRDELDADLDAIVVNGLHPGHLAKADLERLARARANGRGPAARARSAALAAARHEHRRAHAQRAQVRRLRRHAGGPVLTLPYLFGRELDVAALGELGGALVAKLARAS